MTQPRSVGFQRKQQGPWAIVLVPLDEDDPVYPTRRSFITRKGDGGLTRTPNLADAFQFQDHKEAVLQANRYMHRFRNAWAEVLPFPHLWATAYGSDVPWTMRTPTGFTLDLMASGKEVVPDDHS